MSRSVKLILDEGRKIVNLDKRAIRRAATKTEWVKTITDAHKHLGIQEDELKTALGKAWDDTRADLMAAVKAETKK